jgi:surfeit locus 1 family protein|tara:strand:- start:665 stop:1318 length:654 start_codon:yes stop_codon:yes gene_type:complete
LKKISFSIFVFFSIILFCSLGTWQIYRLQWKLDLINEINYGLNSESVPYSKTNIINYQKVKFSGTFDFEKQIYLYSLNSNGKPGYDIITPIKINFNEILLVNRGWISNDLKNNKNINKMKSKSFEGIVKKISKSNPFKPENDIKNNVWYSLKLEDLQNFTGYKLTNFVLYLQNSENNLVEKKIISPDLPNNHLKYAITWYSVALSILLYFLYFRKKQ